jgi:hypothetical protein
MVRAVLGGHCCTPTAGVRVVLSATGVECAPCAAALEVPTEVTEQITGRVIVRHRIELGADDDGVVEYGWTTLYDGPAIWSDIVTTENDDASGTATRTATITLPKPDAELETTASVWDHNRTRWTVTSETAGTAGGLVLSLEQIIDADTTP